MLITYIYIIFRYQLKKIIYFRNLTKVFGVNITSFKDIEDIYLSLRIQLTYNLSLPEEFTHFDPEDFYEAAGYR